MRRWREGQSRAGKGVGRVRGGIECREDCHSLSWIRAPSVNAAPSNLPGSSCAAFHIRLKSGYVLKTVFAAMWMDVLRCERNRTSGQWQHSWPKYPDRISVYLDWRNGEARAKGAVHWEEY